MSDLESININNTLINQITLFNNFLRFKNNFSFKKNQKNQKMAKIGQKHDQCKIV